ncbi:MAG TPA: nucleoside hydrolase [Planctomycetota bacterium]|nr:nucleoside hydrolase [Planctomycetota bacterium]
MRPLLMLLLLPLTGCATTTAPLQPGPWPPPPGALRMVIDTDAANEVDDQHALALALGFPETIRLEGLVAAHLGPKQGAAGVKKSFDEIQEVLRRSPRSKPVPVLQGNGPLPGRDPGPPSEGVRFIIDRARASSPDDPLWLVVLGPVTDAVAALIAAPDIRNRMIVFWHSRSEWPRYCRNFNAKNDPLAALLAFELPSRLILFDTGAQIVIPPADSERRLAPLGPLGAFLHQMRSRNSYVSGPKKGIFDLGDLAAFVEPGCVRWERVSAPAVTEDLSYDFSRPRGELIRITDIDPSRPVDLLEEALRRLR